MFINDIFENEDDMFAGSQRAYQQIQQDRHPLKDYLTFDDYDHLMDEFADAQSAVKNNAELDAYLEQFESGLKNTAIPQVIVEIVEEFVHGRHGKYGTEVPRRNEALLADLEYAFSQIWMDYKPDRFVHTLIRHMSQACVAAIHAEDEYDGFNESEDDDMFAQGKYQKWTRAVDDVLVRLRNEEEAESLYRDYDYLISELARGGLPAFLNGLDMVDLNALESIDSDLAIRKHVNLSDIEKVFYPEQFDESEDSEMFAPSKAERIAEVLDGLAKRFGEYPHSQQSVYYCKKLAHTFRTQGIDRGTWTWRMIRPNTQFSSGGIDTTVHNVVKEKTGFDLYGHFMDLDPKRMRGDYDLDENDDMFSDNRVVVNPKTMATVTRTLATRYDRFAKRDERHREMYADDAVELERASVAFSQHGLHAGMKALGYVVYPHTWEDLEELAADYEINLNDLADKFESGALSESEDDMFSAAPSLAQKLGNAITQRGEGDMEWGEDLLRSPNASEDERDYGHALKIRGAKFIQAGDAFLKHGTQAGMMEWVLIDREDKEPFYNYMREVEHWDVEQVINQLFGLNESADDDGMFAKTPIEKFVDGLKAYVKTIEEELAQEHPTWADHPDTVNKKRVITRIQILIEQLSNPSTKMYGLNQLVAYINSPVSGHLGWIYDIDEFLQDNKFPTIEYMLDRYAVQLNEDQDDMFSSASRKWISFDDLFADQLDLDEERRDDIAGWLYDFDTPIAIDMINELVGGYVTVTDAYFDDAQDDWFFKYK